MDNVNIDSKQHLASSFGRAAESYDRSAHLQKMVGHALCDQLQRSFSSVESRHPHTLLDLGCGTGFFGQRLFEEFSPQVLVFGDISLEMLNCAMRRADVWSKEVEGNPPIIKGLQLDAEKLGLYCNSIDLIFSSLALQWVEDLTEALAQVHQALSNGGRIAFSTLLDGTLHELKGSWATVDAHRHVNDFLGFEQHTKASKDLGFVIELAEQQEVVLPYEKPIQLMKDLKAIGAHNISSERPKALMGKSKLNAVLKAYEQYRRPDGMVPATYNVGYFILRKA